MKLNLGAGARAVYYPDYINTDVVYRDKTDALCDSTLLPFSNDTFEEVRSEHMVEHLSKPQLQKCADEIYRVLKPKGSAIIVAPSLKTGLGLWERGKWDLETLDRFLFANHTHEHDFHKQGIYEQKLRRVFSKFRDLKIEYVDRAHSPNEIVMEAKKPWT